MNLNAWRTKVAKITFNEAGQRLGLSGPNVARNFQRIETGEAPVDADLVVAIGKLTKSEVTGEDLNATRLAWLKENDRARKFAVEPVR